MTQSSLFSFPSSASFLLDCVYCPVDKTGGGTATGEWQNWGPGGSKGIVEGHTGQQSLSTSILVPTKRYDILFCSSVSFSHGSESILWAEAVSFTCTFLRCSQESGAYQCGIHLRHGSLNQIWDSDYSLIFTSSPEYTLELTSKCQLDSSTWMLYHHRTNTAKAEVFISLYKPVSLDFATPLSSFIVFQIRNLSYPWFFSFFHPPGIIGCQVLLTLHSKHTQTCLLLPTLSFLLWFKPPFSLTRTISRVRIWALFFELWNSCWLPQQCFELSVSFLLCN